MRSMSYTTLPAAFSRRTISGRSWFGLGRSVFFGSVLLAAACGVPEHDASPLDDNGRHDANNNVCDSAGLSPSGLTIIGGDQVLLPTCKKSKPIGEALGQSGRHVLFINYDGVDLRVGDSSMENQGIRDPGFKNQGIVQIAPFDPDNSQRFDAITRIHTQVQKWYADVDVDVVLSRPLTGDYQMTVVGGDKTDIGLGGGIVGISPADCKNTSETNLNFAFSKSLRENPGQVAVTIAHEAGHAYGLGHVQNNKDIMYPSVTNAEGFLGGLAADAGPCGFKPGDFQDSKKVLIENLGVRRGEKPGAGSPPSVKILSPSDGAEVGKDVQMAVDARADKGLDHVTLSVSRVEGGKAYGAHPVAELRPPQSAAAIRLSSAGTYQLTATAYDYVGRFAVSSVRFTAGTPTCLLANDCAPGQKCQDHTCVTLALPAPDPAGGDKHLRPIGQACDKSDDCRDGVCAITPVGQICTHYCNPDRLCAGSLECVDGICLPPMYSKGPFKPGTFGGTCKRNQDCGTGECSSPTDDPKAKRYCTKQCDKEAAWSCPSFMACLTTDGPTGKMDRCVAREAGPAGETGEAGGCSVTGPRGDHRRLVFAGLGVLLGLLLARRRINPGL